MSTWLNDGEVLLGQGSGEAIPWSPRTRGRSAGSPRSGLGRGLVSSPNGREAMLQEPQTMVKARELFVLCDKEDKGFITKRDMQRLEGELPLSLEQLEDVFDSLDRLNNGFLTPVEFNAGLGGIMELDESSEQSLDEGRAQPDQVDWTQDPRAIQFGNMLTELGADRLFKDQWEVSSLWCALQREKPELVTALDDILVHTVARVQDAAKERDSLEQALRRRESEHDRIVRSLYEEMESQLKEEREKQKTQDSIKQWDRGQQLEEELGMRDQELESSLTKQRELESSVRALSCEQADVKEQKQQLQSLNAQLREQLDTTREELQTAKSQLNLIHFTDAQENMAKERNVLKVSRNIQKEKESLLRQLEILRDMNKRLRDETDAHQAQKRSPIKKVLLKQGSIIGNYFLQDKPIKRQLSSSSQLGQDKEDLSNPPKRHSSTAEECDHDVPGHMESQTVRPQRVFRVVFLGNSGVGKTSFIRHYCTRQFSSTLCSTVGIDYQMKTIALGSINVVLQLWDTAGQERFRSITQQYYRKADGILSMYDVTDGNSFMAVREWMDCIQERKSEGAVVMLLGNKVDMAGDENRRVTTEEGQKLAEHHQAEFHECSAKSGYNIDTLMSELARMLVAQEDRQYIRDNYTDHDGEGHLAGGAVLAVGVWTVVGKSDYISLLNSTFYSTSAYILIATGTIVVVTGLIGCCATLNENRSLLVVYFMLLLSIFLLEIIAGVMAYMNYQQLDHELRQNLKLTMQHKYKQPGEDSITQAVDKLQQEFQCCGSNSSLDWAHSVWILDHNNDRMVPDSCCKTPREYCGRRDHPSNIFKLEGGCIVRLGKVILSQLHVLGGVGIGIAFLQGKPIDFVGVDESTARWVQDFSVKPYATPAKLESIDGARYQALLIPDCPGALNDLAHSGSLHRILTHFISQQKPVCAVGHGVSALCCATEGQKWIFSGYSLTGPSVFELVRSQDFANLPLIVEDFVKDSGGSYTASQEDAMHVVVDRHLITGQNVQSTSVAVNNLILLSTASRTST
ncbi:hypothetical protein NHX12_002626 [Muraenolepis orangiensis]|uniref:EF-hand domain-containing protein n=1 Tax=Muraenolepis orangiensis TaxID=630683 RepID=A0A9Q0ID79_9TELE|nr:hypothetical protein NHX12_002626 [Muraenolepis orangiensis]